MEDSELKPVGVFTKSKSRKTNKQEIHSLGVVHTPNGDVKIAVMNDLFLNYTFDQQKNNEVLRTIVNIFLEDYIHTVKPHETNITKIEGSIQVETQFRVMIDAKSKIRSQDIRIDEEVDKDKNQRTTFLEFQNKSNTRFPIANRAVEYFGLGVGKGKNSMVNQIWFMAEDSK